MESEPVLETRHGGDVARYIENSPTGTIIDFSANINPLGLPPGVRKALSDSISGITAYPETDSRSLKRTLADFHGIREENLVVGNGSIELVYLIPRALDAKKVLIVTPTFSEYESAAVSNGSQILFYETSEKEGFKLKLSDLEKHLSGVDLVFICNPNNPTGRNIPRNDLLALIELCDRHKAALVIDEAFIDFVDGCDGDDLVLLAAGRKGVIVVRSLTKSFAIPGLRLGYMSAERGVIDQVRRLQYPWNVNSLAQVAGMAALKDRDFMIKSREYISSERSHLSGKLNEIKGLKVFPSDANFILCKLEGCSIKDAGRLNKELIKRGMALRDCGNFRGLDASFFRVAVRTHEDNHKLIEALRAIGGRDLASHLPLAANAH